MKNCIRTTLALLALTAMVGTSVFAAPPAQKMSPQGMRGKGGMQGMADALGLTPAQKTKIKAIMDTSRPQRRAIHDDAKLTPDQKKTKMKAIRESSEKKMMAVLTPAQRKKFMTMMKERRDRMRAMRAGSPKA